MKFSGKVGFWYGDKEKTPGVYKPEIIEKNYTGDVLRHSRQFQAVENQQNDDLKNVSRLSIISDLYMLQNWSSIKYVLWNNTRWQVNSVDISSYPRAILELGGVYNG